MIPTMPMARPLIAPSVSPISTAFEVPTAWEAVPIAIPTATLSFTLNIFNKYSEKIAPNIPVITTETTVIGIIPFKFFVISKAMGVVTDFGRRARNISFFIPNTLEIIYIYVTETIEPVNVPMMIALKCFFNKENLL